MIEGVRKLTGAVLGERYVVNELSETRGRTMRYAARDLRLGIPVTIEVLRDGIDASSDTARLFVARTRVACRVGHPCVWTAISIDGLEDGSPFVVRIAFEGATLAQTVQRDGPLVPDELISVGVSMLSALSSMHAHGIKHGSLGPDNVFFRTPTFHGQPHVTIDGFSDPAVHPWAYGNCACLAYVAPEILRGAMTTEEADIYACGATLFHAATGRAPFAAASRDELVRRVLEGPSPIARTVAPWLPEALASTLTRALACEPERRFESAEAMLEALLQCRRPRQISSIEHIDEEPVSEAVPTVRSFDERSAPRLRLTSGAL
jgi:eukaryotic-like serine/threonine-protein kinase